MRCKFCNGTMVRFEPMSTTQCYVCLKFDCEEEEK